MSEWTCTYERREVGLIFDRMEKRQSSVVEAKGSDLSCCAPELLYMLFFRSYYFSH